MYAKMARYDQNRLKMACYVGHSGIYSPLSESKHDECIPCFDGTYITDFLWTQVRYLGEPIPMLDKEIQLSLPVIVNHPKLSNV